MNLPLVFAAILAGAVLIDYGVKNAKAAFANSPSSGSSGGSSSSAAGPTITSGQAPLPHGATWERTDQGRDASAPAGSPITAIAAGVVSEIVPDFYAGQPAVVIDSPGLPGGATGIYYAEQLIPGVHQGEQIQAGQQIGTVAQQGSGLEFGFWKNGQTLAQATTGYVEGEVTAAGELFDHFLTSLGVKL